MKHLILVTSPPASGKTFVSKQLAKRFRNIVYLDKSTKHMYELNNKIRLIDVSDYMIENADAFLGFILGIVSQDHDLQQMYLDSFLKISHLEGADITETIQKLEKVSEKFKVDFTISVSMEADDVPEAIKSNIEVAV